MDTIRANYGAEGFPSLRQVILRSSGCNHLGARILRRWTAKESSVRLPSNPQILAFVALSLVTTVGSASSVTYDFSGTINSEEGSFRSALTAGEQVSGSFSIDIDAAISGQQSGSTDSAYWVRYAYGGTVENDTTVPPRVGSAPSVSSQPILPSLPF
jgi:hypothetical protein